MKNVIGYAAVLCVGLYCGANVLAQGGGRGPGGMDFGGMGFGGMDFGGMDMMGMPGGMGFGGMGGMMGGMGGPTQKILETYDNDKDGMLNKEERAVARKALESGAGRGGRGGRGGMMGGMMGGTTQSKPGEKVSPADVQNYPDKKLYDQSILRTIFLDFEESDWEAEMETFHGTDVDVAATMTVDGKKYENVGVRFRGMSSYMMIPRGSKRSMNISMGLKDEKQKLYGYKTLNLLNSNGDPSMMHSVVYYTVARNYIPAQKCNLVRVVINGEDWGIYPNVQQANKEMMDEWFESSKGARWKISGNPGASTGLTYLSDNIADYKRVYEIKTKDDEESWKALINVTKVLNKTPVDQLPSAIEPLLDVEHLLWYLALDNVFINEDGYLMRSSDINIYLDPKGMFHILPQDTNETFSMAGGGMMGMMGGGGGGGGGRGGRGGRGGGPGGMGGMGGGGGGGGVALDPFININDATKPLVSKILAVPAYRQKYLEHIRTISDEWLVWEGKFEPVVMQSGNLIDKYIKIDNKKLATYEAFRTMVFNEKSNAPQENPAGMGMGMMMGFGGMGGGAELSYKEFVEQRKAYLMGRDDVKNANPTPTPSKYSQIDLQKDLPNAIREVLPFWSVTTVP